jgi:hypothetical protein
MTEFGEGADPVKDPKTPFRPNLVKPPKLSVFFQPADSDGNINL